MCQILTDWVIKEVKSQNPLKAQENTCFANPLTTTEKIKHTSLLG
jgi:hypothetical protein